MTKIIGLTGGIGSGKTTIANYFSTLGIPVYIADDEAKKLMESSEVKDSIKEKFGESIFDNTILNRAKLAEIAAEAKLTAETAKIMESHSLFICNLVASGVKLADAIKRAKNQK